MKIEMLRGTKEKLCLFLWISYNRNVDSNYFIKVATTMEYVEAFCGCDRLYE